LVGLIDEAGEAEEEFIAAKKQKPERHALLRARHDVLGKKLRITSK
jgi:hypothetical protein